MLEEAIKLINKQKEMYTIQIENLQEFCKTKTVQKAINKIRREIQIWDYILKDLKKQKQK